MVTASWMKGWRAGRRQRGGGAGGGGYCSFFSDSDASSLEVSSSGCVSSYLGRKKRGSAWTPASMSDGLNGVLQSHHRDHYHLATFQNKSTIYSEKKSLRNTFAALLMTLTSAPVCEHNYSCSRLRTVSGCVFHSVGKKKREKCSWTQA